MQKAHWNVIPKLRNSLKNINGIIGFGLILTKQATGNNTANQHQTLGTIISEKIIFIY
jgi:hypothetical protein